MKKRRKSSRKRMTSRSRSRKRQMPSDFAENIKPNRAARRQFLVLWRRQAKADVLEQIREKRKRRLVAIRRKRREIRNETRKAMRRAAGE